MLEPVTAIWIACGCIASLLLCSMMRRRQQQLIELLKSYVDVQSSWTRRKERAAAIAKKYAKKAKRYEQYTLQSRDAKEATTSTPREDVVV